MVTTAPFGISSVDIGNGSAMSAPPVIVSTGTLTLEARKLMTPAEVNAIWPGVASAALLKLIAPRYVGEPIVFNSNVEPYTALADTSRMIACPDDWISSGYCGSDVPRPTFPLW